MIIDTHVHVVSDDRIAYPPSTGAPEWPVTTDEWLIGQMNSLGIDAAMLVQTFFTYGFDNTYAIDAAARTPDRLQVVCVIDQTASDAPEVLTRLVREQNVRGIRFMPTGFPDGVLWDERTFPVWRRAGELGIPVTVAAFIEDLPHMLAVVARFPEVSICFEHMWGLEIGPSPFERIHAIFDLAQFSNVNLKLAPNNSHAARDANVPPEQLFGLLAERFGVDRLMWGSNYPAHPQRFGPLAERLAIMQEDFSFLSKEEQALFFGGNASKLWPFPKPISAQ